MRKLILLSFITLALVAPAKTPHIEIMKASAPAVTVSVEGTDKAFATSLKRNLTLSGAFCVSADSRAAIRVKGAPGSVRVEGFGKALTLPVTAPDEAGRRMEARRLADKMCEIYAHQKGFACDPIVFVNRTGPKSSELCTCYPDGYDIRRLTNDGKSAVGPRWKDAHTIFYTALYDVGPQIYEYDLAAQRRHLKWSFKGLTTGATVSPDGRSVAIILSIHGNPELYVIDVARGTWRRLTNTPHASEGQPSWSPDGRKIVYVSDESRHPNLYVIDVATKKSSRLTAKGTQNVDPDWGPDGRIAYVTKRNGQSQIALISPDKGDRETRLVTKSGNWEHPSWSRDGRNLVATRDSALYVVDTSVIDGEEFASPQKIFANKGKWITPSWSK